MCVSGVGRFIHVDECTVDKARFDFACILVSTPNIEIVNQSVEFIIAGNRFCIKLVEEWGCNLGEDAFMTEVEPVSSSEELHQLKNAKDLDEVQGEWELDDLVNDLHKEWSANEVKKNDMVNSNVSVSDHNAKKTQQTIFFEVNLSPVLSPLPKQTRDESELVCENKLKVQETRQIYINNMGPWSAVFTSACNEESNEDETLVKGNTTSLSSKTCSRKMKSGNVQHSVGLMKKIARMPAHDRKQILHILNKQKRKNKEWAAKKKSKDTTVSTSNTSKNTLSSVNNDWENWVKLKGKAGVMDSDVRELGKVVGVKYQCVTNNRFNLLTREGRR